MKPQQKRPLAAELRAGVPEGPVMVSRPEPDPTDWSPTPRVKASTMPGPLAGEPIWYEDPGRRRLHRDLVRAGMERAKQQGQRIGRPRVTERPEFLQRFAAVVERMGPDGLSRSQAAQELGIGYTTLTRLLEFQRQVGGGQ